MKRFFSEKNIHIYRSLKKSRLAVDWKPTKMARNFGAGRTPSARASPGVTSVWKIASHLRSNLSEMPGHNVTKN